MKLTRWIAGMMLCGSMLLRACGAHAVEENQNRQLSAEETAACVMESLRELDLEQFNRCTDNYVTTYRNWIGIPVKWEYRVFNELLQPGIKVGKWKRKYEFDRELSRRMMEHLTWKIEGVEEKENRAEIAMEITNLNMGDVMGKYELSLLEDIVESTGMGVRQMFGDLLSIMDEEDGLLSIVEACDEDDLSTFHVTVTAFREEGGWKLHLDEVFINAFMGNFNAAEYSEEIQQEIRQKIAELERRQEESLEEWEEEFTDSVEKWYY